MTPEQIRKSISATVENKLRLDRHINPKGNVGDQMYKVLKVLKETLDLHSEYLKNEL